MSTPFLAPAPSLQPPAYSPLVLDHFERPRNVGELLPGRDVVRADAGSREAGAAVTLSVRFLAGTVAEVRFKAYGCPHFLAAASLATERLQGMTAGQLTHWTARDMWGELALPVEKRGRLLILEDAVRAAGNSLST